MRGFTRIALVALVAVVFPVAVLAGDAGKPLTLSPDQLKWVPNPDVPGVMTAVTWGDPAKGAHGAFHKFKAGFSVPLHTHGSSNKIVVLSGTMSMAGADGKEMTFPAGSFYTQPVTFKHTTRCTEALDCLVYLEADAKWELKMEPAK